MSQNTENIEAKLSAYIDGELDAAGRAEIERHLVANPHHKKMIEELMMMRGMLRELPRELAPNDLQETLQGQLERSSLLGEPGDNKSDMVLRINRWPQIIAVAAILLLAVGLASVVYFVVAPSSRPMFTSATQQPAPEDGGADAVAPETVATGAAPMARTGNTGLGSTSDEARRKEIALAKADGTVGADAIAAKRGMTEDRAATTDIAAKSADGVLARTEGKGAGATGEGGVGFAMAHPSNASNVPTSALYVVVQTDNPSAANDQLAKYLTVNNIHWEPVAEATELPVTEQEVQAASDSPSGQSRIQLKLQVATLTPDTNVAAAPGANGGTGGADMTIASGANGKILTGQDIAENDDAAGRGNAAKSAQTVIAESGVAATTVPATTAPLATDAPVQTPAANATATTTNTNTTQPAALNANVVVASNGGGGADVAIQQTDLDLTQRAVQTQQLQQRQIGQNQLNADGTRNRAIVARQMTRRQAVELQAAMSQQDIGQRALVVDKLEETRALAPTDAELLANSSDKKAAETDAAKSKDLAGKEGEKSEAAVPPSTAPSATIAKVEEKDELQTPPGYQNARLREDASKSAKGAAPEPTPSVAEAQKPGEVSGQGKGDQPVLLPGDSLRVRLVEGTKDESVDVVVGADGTVDVPHVGRVSARGLTLAELGAAIKTEASKHAEANLTISAHVEYAAKSAGDGWQGGEMVQEAHPTSTTKPSGEQLAAAPNGSTTQPAMQAEANAANLGAPGQNEERVDVVIVVQSNQIEAIQEQNSSPALNDATTQPADAKVIEPAK